MSEELDKRTQELMGMSTEELTKIVEGMQRKVAGVVPLQTPQEETRVAYHQRAIMTKLDDDEPYFVFRAKDILSTFALDEYLGLVERFYPGGEKAMLIVDKINEFREWQRNNPTKVKIPD